MVGSGPFRKNREGDSPAGGTDVPADAVVHGTTPAGATPGTPSPAARPARLRGGRDRRTVSLAGSAALAGRGARKAGRSAKAGLASLGERLMEQAPRIPVRDLATLRAQFPGLDPEQLADRLVKGAVRGTTTLGAGVGAAAALPTPPAMPAELATETLAVAAVEIKLIAELHEVYGLRAPGNASQRATAYVGSWANRRGVDALKHGSVTAALSGQLKKELRQRLLKRTVRNLPALTPFFVGAAIGGAVNRRDTRKLADQIRADLRSRAVSWDRLEPAALSFRPERKQLPGTTAE